MYVIYPAEELLRIYDGPRSILTGVSNRQCQVSNWSQIDSDSKRIEKRSKFTGRLNFRYFRKKGNPNSIKAAAKPETTVAAAPKRERKTKKEIMQNNRNTTEEGTANPLKELTHASLNEPLKNHNANTLKLVQTGQYSYISSDEKKKKQKTIPICVFYKTDANYFANVD